MRHIVQRFWSRGGWLQIALIVVVTVLALGSCSGASSVKTSPTATPLPSPTATPSGPPALGAPETIFLAAYGPIVSHPTGDSDKFWADKVHTITLTVTFSSGQATNITVILRAGSWTATYTFNYCHAFLPPGASKVRTVGQITVYQSTLGSVVLILTGPGICSVGFNR